VRDPASHVLWLEECDPASVPQDVKWAVGPDRDRMLAYLGRTAAPDPGWPGPG
jgi:hypothetical protein